LAFYDVFEELCAQKGVTPTQAGRDNGIAQGVVSMWKKRGSTPKAETVQKLADYFGVDPRELMGIDESVIFRIRSEGMVLTQLLYGLSKGELTEYDMRALSEISARWSRPLSAQIYEHMSQLNDIGRKKVEDYAGDLAEIPRYRCQDAPQSTSAPQVDTDTAPAADAPETPPEGE